MKTEIKINNIAHHRNGICGAPFWAITFTDSLYGEFIAAVFEQDYHVAVFNIELLAQGNINFGENSWRGDYYEPKLRKAIEDYQKQQKNKELTK